MARVIELGTAILRSDAFFACALFVFFCVGVFALQEIERD